jgi:hypothetical protein
MRAGNIQRRDVRQQAGRASFEGATLTQCSMLHMLARGVCFDGAIINESQCNNADFSFATFINTNLTNSSLYATTLLAVTFSDEVILANTDVTCALLLGARHDNKPVTRSWLKERGALHSHLAITNVQELVEILNLNLLDLQAAEELKHRLNLTFDELSKIQHIHQTGHPLLSEVTWKIPFATNQNLHIMQQAYYLLTPYIFNLSRRDRLIINENTFLSLVEQKNCPQQVKLQPYMTHEKPINKKSINELADIMRKGRMPEIFELTLQGMNPHFVEALLQTLKTTDTQQLKMTVDCSVRNFEILKIFIDFMQTRDPKKKVMVEFVNIAFGSAKILMELFGNKNAARFMFCGELCFANEEQGDLCATLRDAAAKHALNQVALACVTLRQGQQKATQPLARLNNDSLNEIFSRALPASLSLRQKGTIINNIYAKCPAGLMIFANNEASQQSPAIASAKPNAFGFKRGFLNRK